ncbi:MAG: hypothetical protein HY320_08875 [Armatimonadetes bacterium]|nr:hypothetical protein [Armatimonadota bacterium]
MRLDTAIRTAGLILALAAAGPALAHSQGHQGHAHGKAKTAQGRTITCPVMKSNIPISKAIKVVHKGKTYYVCCKRCIAKVKTGRYRPNG